MRGSLVAACAAVLVGLAPAMPLASFAAAAACATADTAVSVSSSSVGAAFSSELPASALSKSGRSADRPDGERAPSIWRDPSAPAPSQAPPARA